MDRAWVWWWTLDMLRGKQGKSIWERHTREKVYGVGKTKVFWVLVRELASRGVRCERLKVKKVAVITPRFGAESTPADQARSGLYSVLVEETLANSQSSNDTAKITYYGDQFMKVIDRFWVEENIEIDLFPPRAEVVDEASVLDVTVQYSYMKYKEGKTVEQLAQERGFVSF